jgi:hypothetical protein
MASNIFANGGDRKVFFCAINFPGSWHDYSLPTMCFHTFGKTLDVITFEVIKVSQGVTMQLGFLLAL